MREMTSKILDAVEEGLLDPMTVITACLLFMPEDMVKDMAHHNQFFEGLEEEQYK